MKRSADTPTKIFRNLILSAIVLASLGASADVAVPPLLKLPDGYQNGRADATYGTYSSLFLSPAARSFQTRLTNLERRVMGFSFLANKDRVAQSEAVFVLEQGILKLHLDIANAPENSMSKFERQGLLYSTVRTYQSLRFQAERLFEDMVRYIDVQLPGPNGLQFRNEIDANDISPAYLANYRSDNHLTQADRDKLYAQKLSEFIAKGGSLDQIAVMTPDYLAKLGSYTRLEYVMAADGDLRVTEGSAGHILLAGGASVFAGGQIILIKNNVGQFTMAVISNSSGSFKPDIYSILHSRDKLAKLTGLSSDFIVTTKGEPLSAQAVKVYSKGMGLPKDLIAARVDRLDHMVDGLHETPTAALTCSALFQ